MDTEQIQLAQHNNTKNDYSNECERSPSISSNGLSVVWRNVTVVVKQKESTKTKLAYKEIIHNVSGAVHPGTLVAILGASGSGKSTLMSVLANRNPGGLQMYGDIRIGRKPIGSFTRHVSGFVYQDDLFLSTLTVMEHLNFTAKLRLDKEITKKARLNLIHQILLELGLLKVAHSRIGESKFGDEKVNLSGGERKRLSIATELLTDPGLLFCDEPTTGLDSFTALKVISNLKYLANERQKTIICSIHQPNDQIFSLFHHIILLSNGKIAFSGNSQDALDFFKSQGHHNVQDQNPADYLVQSLAKVTSAEKLFDEFEKSDYYSKINEYIKSETNPSNKPDLTTFKNTKYKSPSWLQKLAYVSHRSFLTIIRDSSVQKMRIIQKLLLGLIIGICMQGTITPTQTGLQALKGVIFLLIGQNFFPAIHAAMDHVPKHMPIFYREYANSTNTPLIFYLSNVLSLLPGFIVDPIMFTLLVYWLTSLQENISAIVLTCVITMLVLNTSAAFGMFMSTVFKSRSIASAVTTPIDFAYIICSGVFIKLSTIPVFLRWIRYVSWFTYAIEALFIVQLDGVNRIDCFATADVPCLHDGTEVLSSYDFYEYNLWPNIINIFCIYLIVHIGAYLGLLNQIRSRKI